MSPLALTYARQLDLALVLGSSTNEQEFLHLLCAIDDVGWGHVSIEQEARAQRTG